MNVPKTATSLEPRVNIIIIIIILTGEKLWWLRNYKLLLLIIIILLLLQCHCYVDTNNIYNSSMQNNQPTSTDNTRCERSTAVDAFATATRRNSSKASVEGHSEGHRGADDDEQQRQMVLASKVSSSMPREKSRIVCGWTLTAQHQRQDCHISEHLWSIFL